MSCKQPRVVFTDGTQTGGTARRYWTLVAGLLGLFLVAYFSVEAFDVSLLSNPATTLQKGGVFSALLGVGFLVSDAFIPVPSSLVMASLGAVFGAPLGIALGLAGRVGMAALGFAVGRRGGWLVERLVSPAERARADELLRRHGALAIVISRPVPILAETIVVLAGASPLGWRSALFAAVLGSLPEVVVYAVVGAMAVSIKNAVLVWGSFLAVVTVFWLVTRWTDRRVFEARRETRS